MANLHAFARLYGVVRWFHPSDAAAAIDWDRFAIDGARRVIDARDSDELREDLRALFAPIAPTMRIGATGSTLAAPAELHPPDTSGLDVVAWEHLGYGDSTIVSAYQSKRRHRARTVLAPASLFGSMVQTVDATPFRGARVRLRGKLRVAGGGQGKMWLRVDRAGGSGVGFFENMDERPIRATTWTDAEITGIVSGDATALAFGLLFNSPGTIWYDDLELAVERDGTWQPIPINDPGFEAPDPHAAWHSGIGKEDLGLDGWTIDVDRDHPASGASSLRVTRATTTITGELFDDGPAPGETVDVDLGSGLHARVPIALYSRGEQTLGDDPVAALRNQATTTAAAVGPGFDTIGSTADVIVVWNVLQHFWPYWGDVQADWNQELDRALTDALDDQTPDDHVATLERLSAAAPDAHASVTCPGETSLDRLPLALASADGQLVVTATGDEHVQRGDVLVSIDGRPVEALLAERSALVSGSPQWRMVRAIAKVTAGPTGTTSIARFRRDAHEFDVSLTRSPDWPSEDYSHPPIDHLDGGIWYVDLARASMPDIDAVMDKLASAPGVVFDMRGYPNSTHPILSHLIAHAEASRWMHIAHVVRPDHVEPTTWEHLGWDMPRLEPHLAGKLVFLTGPRAVSYAESVMGYVEAEHLPIVGAATAGTNGNIAEIAEPTGCTTIFTGMRVTRHDGSPHHLEGVKATLPVSRTIAGIRAGKDEILDAAVAAIRSAP